MSSLSPISAWTFLRSSGVEINPTLMIQRANQFATKSEEFSSTTLLLRREESTLRGYLLTRGGQDDGRRAAFDLAQAVGARAEECPVPEGLTDGNVVGWMVFESGSSVGREPQVGADPHELVRALANTLPLDAWVAVTLRPASKKERKWHGAWLAHRFSTALPTHHSMSTDAVVVSVIAGAEDPATVTSVLRATRSGMPGFDIATSTRVATRTSTLGGWAIAALAGLGSAIGPLFVAGVPDVAGPGLLVPGLVVGGGSGLVAGLRFAGLLPSTWRRTQSDIAAGRFDPPKRRRSRPTAPRATRHVGEKTIAGREGDYPLHPTAFLVGPQVVAGIVAPQAGAMSGETSTRVRPVPAPMLRRIGPLIGDTDQGPAYLSAADAFGGVAVVGKAGSGKSVLVRSLFGWSCLERQAPSGLPGFPGERNALVAFESKGDGVGHYQRWAAATNDVLLIIDIADPSTWGIDLFAVPGTPTERANFFANALVYAFREGAIGDRSFETLLAVLPAALVITPAMAALVPDLIPDASPVYLAHVLLGGRGDELGRALYAELAAESVREGADPTLREAVLGLASLYGANVTTAQRRTLCEAPRNKLRQLAELESWWTPTRPKVTWDQILGDHRIVVINTGSVEGGRIVEDQLSEQMSALLMFSLRHAIQRICGGWQEQGRSVSIFADELSLLAGSSETVISWLKDQGRSFGVRPFLATQRPEQLPDKVRSAFMNFSTLISYMQEDMKTARETAEGVSGEEGEWSAADVLQLATYTAVVRGHVDKKRQPAFTVAVRDFEADRTLFAAQQGFTGPDPVAAPVLAEPVPAVAEAPVLAEPVAPAPVALPVVEASDPVVADINLIEW